MTQVEALAVLSLPERHTLGELRLAYKRAAFNAHPDRGGSNDALKRINAAYEALGGKGDGGGFTVDVEAVTPQGSARKRQAGAPMPREHEAQKKVLFQCQWCRTVFVGGGLAVASCTQVLPDKRVCGGPVERYGAPAREESVAPSLRETPRRPSRLGG